MTSVDWDVGNLLAARAVLHRAGPSMSAAVRFLEKYFSPGSGGSSHPALGVLNRLTAACKSLSLEVNHTKLLDNVLHAVYWCLHNW